ncbi:hypothetical protein os4_10000 [Comamonadaceae bacterium OS-4]|nr:hypothetical protein os4_10000 [Comamonadaceae bacterium OS-4]
MRTLIACFIALIALTGVTSVLGWNLNLVAFALLLVVGLVLAPYRAYQTVVGHLVGTSGVKAKGLWLVSTLFLFAFLFWLGLIWGSINIYFLRSCTGDNCLSYFFMGAPFPFLYGLAEVLLLRIKSRHATSIESPPM